MSTRLRKIQATCVLALGLVTTSMQACGSLNGGFQANSTSGSGSQTEGTSGGAGNSDVVPDALLSISNPVLYAATLDGTYGFKINGVRGSDSPGFSDELGSFVSNVGDLDGDGKNEIFVAARSAENPNLSKAYNSGRGYVIFGATTSAFVSLANGTNGFSLSLLNGSNGIVIDKGAQASYLGQCAGGGGDFNGDGISDLILADQVASGSSSAFLLYGDKDTGDGKSFRQLHNANVLSLSGFSDLNGDGNDDGAILGGFSTATIPISSQKAGDIDGDGKDDLLIGDANRNSNSGEAVLVFGNSSTSLDSHSNLVADGVTAISFKGRPNDFAGKSVSGVGDINKDGISDFAISATNFGLDGKVFVIYGNRNRAKLQELSVRIASVGFQAALDGSNGFSLDNAPFASLPVVQAQMGDNVVGLGDFNGDAIDDFSISEPTLGIAIIIFGRSTGFPALVDVEATLKNSNLGVGIAAGARTIAWAGDINKDGKNDLLIGSSGRAFVVFGRNNLFSYKSEPEVFKGYGQKFIDLTDGQSYSGGGDQLLLGQSLNGLAIRLDGPAGGDFANSVSGLGDINGDGYGDAIIGDRIGRPTTVIVDPFGSNQAGQAFVFFGRKFTDQ